jgi:predicted DNA-binding transcriptional regulator AlpA
MPDEIDTLIANKVLAKRLDVTPRTLFRWAEDPAFPRPLKIGFKRYFRVREIEAWLRSRQGESAPMPPPGNPDAPAIIPAGPRPAKQSLIDRANATLVHEEGV